MTSIYINNIKKSFVSDFPQLYFPTTEHPPPVPTTFASYMEKSFAGDFPQFHFLTNRNYRKKTKIFPARADESNPLGPYIYWVIYMWGSFNLYLT